MSIGGIQISAEAIGAILLGFGGVLTAIGIWLRAKAKVVESNAKKLAGDAKKLEAEAQKTLNESQAELGERQAITDTLKQYSALLSQQIVINQQQKERADQQEETYQKRLQEKERRDEQNYRVLQQLQDRHHDELNGVLKRRFDHIDTTLAQLPGKLQEDNKAWVSTLLAELVAQFAERFAELTLSQEWYPFPDASDPEWREDYIKPLLTKVRVYRRPVLSDTSLTDVQLTMEGENVEIIQGRKKGWLVVRLVRDKKSMYGWLPEHEVLTGLNAIKRATGEAAAVVLTPAPASP